MIKGQHHSQKTKEKISKSMIGENNPNYGKKHPGLNKGRKFSEEHKLKLSKSLKGKKSWNKGMKTPAETIKKNSEVQKQMYKDGYINPMKGRKHKYETKLKISNNKERNKKISNKLKNRVFNSDWKKKLRISAIKRITKKGITGFSPNIGVQEREILKEIELSNNISLIKQYEIDGYFVDGYCKKLNIVFEVDERPKINKRDVERENYIKEKLNCQFIRIPTFIQ